jgi:hypothetical protein
MKKLIILIFGFAILSLISCHKRTGTLLFLSKPVGLTTTNISYNSAALSWTAVKGATSYTVYYKTSSNFSYTATTGITAAHCDLLCLIKGTAYTWYVVAVNAIDTSANSVLDTFTTTDVPAATAAGINGLTLSGQVDTINNNVTLTWSTTTEFNADNFQIQRSSDNGNSWVNVGVVPTKAPNGNSSILLNYELTDAAVPPGFYLYHLLASCLDGSVLVSNLVFIYIR